MQPLHFGQPVHVDRLGPCTVAVASVPGAPDVCLVKAGSTGALIYVAKADCVPARLRPVLRLVVRDGERVSP